MPNPFHGHSSSDAQSYAAYRPRWPQELVSWLATLPRARALAWESGCGSGQLSVALADEFERVIASDSSAAQLAQAEPHARVEYRHASAEHSGLAAASVDLVVAAQAAHWFDLDAFYAEARRVARDGAAIALASYGRFEIAPEIDGLVRRFDATTIAPFWPVGREHVDDGYRTLPFPFAELPVPRLEMRASFDLDELRGYIRTWTAVRALVNAGGADALHSFEDELTRAWPDAHARRTVHWPLALRAARLR